MVPAQTRPLEVPGCRLVPTKLMSLRGIFDRNEQSSRPSHVRYASKSDHSRRQLKLSRCAINDQGAAQ